MAVEEVYPLIQLDAGGGGVPESFEGVGDVARRELEACFFGREVPVKAGLSRPEDVWDEAVGAR